MALRKAKTGRPGKRDLVTVWLERPWGKATKPGKVRLIGSLTKEDFDEEVLASGELRVGAGRDLLSEP